MVLAVAGGFYISFAGWPSASGTPPANLPRYARSNPVIQLAYQYALDRPDVLSYIPCYCGCGGHSGHKSNLSCYITSANQQGQVVFDEHGANCDTCVYITRDAKQLTEQGKSLLEVRQYIDKQYGNLGPGTNTPMPKA